MMMISAEKELPNAFQSYVGHSNLAAVLLQCSKSAARAASEHEALQVVCDLLVEHRLFRGASIGFHQAGTHRGATSNQCFLLRVDGQLLGALTVSSVDPDAFEPTLVEVVSTWCESLAVVLAAVRRRALHGRAGAWSEPGGQLQELQRTESALRRSEAFLAKAQRLSLTGSFSLTLSTGESVWSNETFRIFGCDPALGTPRFEDVLVRVHPDDRERVAEVFLRAAREGEAFESEARLRFDDGAIKHIRIVAHAIGCPLNGELVGAIMDVTAIKEMEQALLFRDQMMGILGHDLRNPLSAILGLAQLGLLDQGLPAPRREQLERIDHAARRMHEMIDTLLDFAQTRFAGKLPIRPAHVDLAELCRGVVDELEVAHPEATIAIDAHGDTVGAWDPARIAQVISNLVGNALAHGDSTAPVRVSIDGAARTLTLAVHNDGEPIPVEQMATLFEPFRRGGSPSANRPRGLGLGLHIAKQIVTAHGGAISVRSSAVQGTLFTVELPRRADDLA